MTSPGGTGNSGQVGGTPDVRVPTPDQVNEFHRYDDVDFSDESHHHTLGNEKNQATAGDHNHNGKNSAILAGYATNPHAHTFGAVITETGFGQAANSGVSPDFSRADHTHGTPANPVTLGAVTAQTTFGLASNNGAASSVSRSDHRHGTPPLGTTAGTAAEGNHTHPFVDQELFTNERTTDRATAGGTVFVALHSNTVSVIAGAKYLIFLNVGAVESTVANDVAKFRILADGALTQSRNVHCPIANVGANGVVVIATFTSTLAISVTFTSEFGRVAGTGTITARCSAGDAALFTMIRVS